jgi:outer membrane receptor protein involved in Fe transport
MLNKKHVLLSVAAVGVVLQVLPASARVEEIIVTARKRKESVLNVPVVETVITQKALEQSGTNDLYAITKHVTGVLLGEAVNAAGSQISIRGVGTTALNQTIDQSTSLNLDGLSLTQGLAYSAGMFDVGQVEVLKGPQSLFYGKNSPAGVISLRSADPTDRTEIILRGGYETGAEEKVGEAVLSGPITSNLKGRLAAHYSTMEGYFNNVAQVIPGLGARNPDPRFPKKDEFIIRGTALFDIGDNYTARMKFTHTAYKEDGTDTSLDVTYCPDGTVGVAPTYIPFQQGDDCKLDNNFRAPWGDPSAFPLAPNNAVPFARIYQDFGTLEQNLKVAPELTLTSVTTLYNNKLRSMHLASTTNVTIPILAAYDFSTHQVSQELRLTSDYSTALNFMLGGYYQSSRTMNKIDVFNNQALAGYYFLFGFPRLLGVQHYINQESISVFGQGRWKITPDVELAAGGRWTHEKRDHTQYNFGPLQGPVGPTALIDPHISSNNFAPEVSVTYKPTTDLTLFASFKEGYKSGSFNSSTFINSTTKASFNDEKVIGGEGGVKALLFDRHLNVNLAGYHYHYKNLQVGALELQQLPAGQGVTYSLRTINAASANVDGVDFDVTWTPANVEGLSLFTAVNYNKARYDKFTNAPCGNGQTIAQGCNQLLSNATGLYTAQNLSGRPLVKAPEWMLNFGFDYDTPIGNDMSLTLGTSVNYSSKYATALVETQGLEQSAYAQIGANIGLKGPNDKWELALIGKNLTDKYVSSWCINSNIQNGTVLGGQIAGGPAQGPAGGDETVCSVQRGREIWFRVTLRPLVWLGD